MWLTPARRKNGTTMRSPAFRQRTRCRAPRSSRPPASTRIVCPLRRLNDDAVRLPDIEHRDAQMLVRRVAAVMRRAQTAEKQQWRSPACGPSRFQHHIAQHERDIVRGDCPCRRRLRPRVPRFRQRADCMHRTNDPRQQPAVDIGSRLRQVREAVRTSCAPPSSMVAPTTGTTSRFASTAYGENSKKTEAVSGHVPICVAIVERNRFRITSSGNANVSSAVYRSIRTEQNRADARKRKRERSARKRKRPE